MSACLISKGIRTVESPSPKTKSGNMSRSLWSVSPCHLCLLPTEAVGRKHGHHKGSTSIVCVDVISSSSYYYLHYANWETRTPLSGLTKITVLQVGKTMPCTQVAFL